MSPFLMRFLHGAVPDAPRPRGPTTTNMSALFLAMRPTFSCASWVWRPSSSMSPSTAIFRPKRLDGAEGSRARPRPRTAKNYKCRR
ncbi:MAG: hypothetical protein WDN09_03960 [bacterium]